jgi:hypothetical protein
MYLRASGDVDGGFCSLSRSTRNNICFPEISLELPRPEIKRIANHGRKHCYTEPVALWRC